MLTVPCRIVLQLVPSVENSENDLRWQLHSAGYALENGRDECYVFLVFSSMTGQC